MPDQTKLIGAAAELAKAIPIYEDVLRPAAKELGTALGTTARLVNIALSPVAALVWGYDQIKAYLVTHLEQKLSGISPDRIGTPDPAVICPAVEALRYNAHKETIRDLFLNLIASSMDAQTAPFAHPAFVEIIRSFSPDEARILRLLNRAPVQPVLDIHLRFERKNTVLQQRLFNDIGEKAQCQAPDLSQMYLDNIARLGLIEYQESGWVFPESPAESDKMNDSWFTHLQGHEALRAFVREIMKDNHELESGIAGLRLTWNGYREPAYRRRLLRPTVMGDRFISACVSRPSEKLQCAKTASADE
jgi:hypothetical protein